MTQNLRGQIKGGYNLLQMIGSGGFGAVYRAHQSIVDREVAVKVILREHANNPEFIRSFDAEAHMVARLEHPFVVPLYDYWRDSDGAYIVMRFYPAGSLASFLINHGAIPLEDTAKMLEQIASALDAAHHHNILHRDIKPANILLDKEGNAYLSDFGLAKDMGEDDEENKIVGSPAYIAPELIRWEKPSPLSDIYSLGFVTHEMLTGQYAYASMSPSSSIVSILDFHLRQPVPDISDVPDAINLVLQRATAKDPQDRYQSAGEMAAAFQSAMQGEASTDHYQISSEFIINPYKGLRPFVEADAQDFFGREQLVKRLLDQLDKRHENYNFLALVGPSGSGKSSVVHAGLLPALRNGGIEGSENWFIVNMLPGASPITQLSAGLRSIALNPMHNLEQQFVDSATALRDLIPRLLFSEADRLVLVIDQFEEVFTQTEDNNERRQFLDLLYQGLESEQLYIIIMLRADFYDRPMFHDGFGALIQARTQVILPLTSTDLTDVITNPAKRAGLQVESDLTAAIVADVHAEAVALPLLQYALTEVFDRRSQNLLTLDAYRAIGGIAGALAHRADEIFAELESQAQQAARQIFLRLVTLGEGTEDTRRRAKHAELLSVVGDNALLQTVLDSFGKARLLTFDNDEETREPTVEIAHEALIREWQTLRDWLDNSRDDIRQQRTLYNAALEWQNAKQDDSYLLRGTHLSHLMEWSETTDVRLNALEAHFLKISAEERQKHDDMERARKVYEGLLEQRSRNRLRYLVIVFAAAAVIALILSGIAFTSLNVARDAQQQADQKAEEAQSIALSANAQKEYSGGNTDLAIALAMAAVNVDTSIISEPPALAYDTLLEVSHAPGLIYEEQLSETGLEHIAISPDGKFVIGAAGVNQSSYWSGQSRVPPDARQLGQPPQGQVPQGQSGQVPPGQASLPPRGQVGQPPQGQSGLPARGQVPQGQPGPASANPPAPPTSDIILWDLHAREVLATLTEHTGFITSLIFIPDSSDIGYTFISASDDGTVIIWDMATREIRYQIEGVPKGFINLSTSADGHTLLISSADQIEATNVLILVDTQTGEIIKRVPAQQQGLALAKISPDGQAAVSIYLDGTQISWDTQTGEEIARFKMSDLRLESYNIAISADNHTVAANTGNVEIQLWDLHTGEKLGVARSGSTATHLIEFSADETHLLTATRDGLLSLWDVKGQYFVRQIVGYGAYITSLAWEQNGHIAVAGTRDGNLRVYAMTPDPIDLVRDFNGHGIASNATLLPSNDGLRLLAASRNYGNAENPQGGVFVLWNADTGEEIQHIAHFDSPGLEFSITDDGHYLLDIERFGGNPASDLSQGPPPISIWDLEADNLIHRIACPRPKAATPPFAVLDPTSGQNDKSLRALIACNDELFMWNPEQGKPNSLRQFKQPIKSLTFSPLGDTLLIVTESDELIWLNIDSNTILTQIQLDGTMDAGAMKFFPDAKNAALGMTITTSAEQDGGSTETDHTAYAIVLLDLQTGEISQTLLGHDLNILSIDISADGKHIVSGSSDNSVIYWDVETGQIIKRFELDARVLHVAFTPDESMIMTTTEDGIPQLWQLKSLTLDEAIDWTLKNRQVRELNPGECARLQIQNLCASRQIVSEEESHSEAEPQD